MAYIYVYTKPAYVTHGDKQYQSLVKIGHTYRTPEERIKEQDGTSEPEEFIVLKTFEVDNVYGEFDLVVHRTLEQWGYERPRSNREWFIIPAATPEERFAIIHEAIQIGARNPNASRIPLHLTPPQYQTLEQTVESFNGGSMSIVAELCPRFGKTAWAICLLQSMQERVLVVSTYWLSALTSFRSDVAKFDEFVNVRYVDASEENYGVTIQRHLDDGYKVIVGVSLYSNAERRQLKREDLQPIVDIEDKIVFVDEADFGAWQPTQRELVDFLNSSTSKLILATGTNGARAATGRTIDDHFSVTYFDMLLAKDGKFSYAPHLNLPFKMASNLDSLPDIEFYQLSFPELIDASVLNKDNLPSWSKVIEDPHKAKGFIRSLFGALFNGEGPYEYMAFEHIFGTKPTGIMVWLNEGGRKDNIDKFAKLLQSFIPDWEVYALHGDVTDNRNAEQEVKNLHAKAIREGKNGVVVVSMKMGARSFSVPEIDTVILAYDKGSAAQTAQKSSRGLTRGVDGKVCRVLSLSLDPSREDKLDAPILETAQKLADKEGIDINQAVKIVLRTLNVFTMDHAIGERVSVDVDVYTQKVLSLTSLTKIVATTADIATIMQDREMVEKILQITAMQNTVGKAEKIVELGKKFLDNKGKVKRDFKPKDNEERDALSLWLKIENAIKALVDNSVVIAGMTPHSNITESLNYLSSDSNFSAVFMDEFGVEPAFVLDLCEKNIISTHLINLVLAANAIETQAYVNDFWK